MKCGIVISLQDVSFSWLINYLLNGRLQTNNRLTDPSYVDRYHMAREAMIKDDFVTTECLKLKPWWISQEKDFPTSSNNSPNSESALHGHFCKVKTNIKKFPS